MGEFSNYPLEELVEWIKASTPRGSQLSVMHRQPCCSKQLATAFSEVRSFYLDRQYNAYATCSSKQLATAFFEVRSFSLDRQYNAYATCSSKQLATAFIEVDSYYLGGTAHRQPVAASSQQQPSQKLIAFALTGSTAKSSTLRGSQLLLAHRQAAPFSRPKEEGRPRKFARVELSHQYQHSFFNCLYVWILFQKARSQPCFRCVSVCVCVSVCACICVRERENVCVLLLL